MSNAFSSFLDDGVGFLAIRIYDRLEVTRRNYSVQNLSGYSVLRDLVYLFHTRAFDCSR